MSAGILQQLREDGSLTGWRSESYPVLTGFHSEPLALVERAAAVHLGIKAYGVHVNGFVRAASGIELWVATRSRDKPTWPGRLDHIVAGGQVGSAPCVLSCQRLYGTHCQEDASFQQALAEAAREMGACHPNLCKLHVHLPCAWDSHKGDRTVLTGASVVACAAPRLEPPRKRDQGV